MERRQLSVTELRPGEAPLPNEALRNSRDRKVFAGTAVRLAPAPTSAAAAPDIVPPDEMRPRERFLPVTRHALIDRLTRAQAWHPGEAKEARRLFRYLAYWRQQQYGARIMRLEQDYEPFNPDTDLLVTRQFTDDEKLIMQKRLVGGITELLEQANYVRVAPHDVAIIMTKESHYGLDFHVDLDAFEELLVFYRGASTRTDQRRTMRKFFRKSEFEVPIFQRLLILFKLKPDGVRVEEVMRKDKIDRQQATKIVRKLRKHVPPQVSADNIYMKLFRDMPRADIEMVFPNTRVKFRLLDKIKMGITGGGALGMGAFGAAGKLALAATNPIAAAGAVATLGAVAFRQVMGAFNQHQRYMVVMAQNLYFHALGDNRGVMILLGDSAAEQDVKEEILLYSVLAKERVHETDLPAVDNAIEQFMRATFGVDVDFDINDALDRLCAEGLVAVDAEGWLTALPPRDGHGLIDQRWDVFLDNLPDTERAEGEEFVGAPGGAAHGPAAAVVASGAKSTSTR